MDAEHRRREYRRIEQARVTAQAKKRDAVLRFLAGRFEPDRMYDEREVNETLLRYHDDCASLRRYLVDTGQMKRQIVRVVGVKSLVEGHPEVEHQIAYWRPRPEEER